MGQLLSRHQDACPPGPFGACTSVPSPPFTSCTVGEPGSLWSLKTPPSPSLATPAKPVSCLPTPCPLLCFQPWSSIAFLSPGPLLWPLRCFCLHPLAVHGLHLAARGPCLTSVGVPALPAQSPLWLPIILEEKAKAGTGVLGDPSTSGRARHRTFVLAVKSSSFYLLSSSSSQHIFVLAASSGPSLSPDS